jgi:hypothetical protein
LRTVFAILLIAIAQTASADFWVCNHRTANGSGTQASPWKDVTDISMSSVATALASGTVKIYFCSRDLWTQASTIRPPTASESKQLFLVGDEQFNLTTTGTADWTTETAPLYKHGRTGNGAILTNNSAFAVGGFLLSNNTSFVTVKGFRILRPFSGLSSEESPQTNIHHITLTNSWVFGDRALTAYGFSFVFAETGCHSFKVSNCIISNTLNEAIYVMHYNFLTNTGTNIVIEYTDWINSGLDGEGECDLKSAATGAIVRYCRAWRDPGLTGGSQTGVVVAGNGAQIYGCDFHTLFRKISDDDFGHGIYFNADGADGVGFPITNGLVYNCLFYSNQTSGIRILGTLAPCTGIRLLNNTFAYNGRIGLALDSSSGYAITVSQLTNCLFLNNSNYDVSLANSDCHLTAADYDLIYRPSGNPVSYQGTDRSWAQWQGLGFDSHGVSADPLLDSRFYTESASPARGAAANLSAIFTTDLDESARGSSWTIGAYHGEPPLPDQPFLSGAQTIRGWRKK